MFPRLEKCVWNSRGFRSFFMITRLVYRVSIFNLWCRFLRFQMLPDTSYFEFRIAKFAFCFFQWWCVFSTFDVGFLDFKCSLRLPILSFTLYSVSWPDHTFFRCFSASGFSLYIFLCLSRSACLHSSFATQFMTVVKTCSYFGCKSFLVHFLLLIINIMFVS